jgi:hypothetical protein
MTKIWNFFCLISRRNSRRKCDTEIMQLFRLDVEKKLIAKLQYFGPLVTSGITAKKKEIV